MGIVSVAAKKWSMFYFLQADLSFFWRDRERRRLVGLLSSLTILWPRSLTLWQNAQNVTDIFHVQFLSNAGTDENFSWKACHGIEASADTPSTLWAGEQTVQHYNWIELRLVLGNLGVLYQDFLKAKCWLTMSHMWQVVTKAMKPLRIPSQVRLVHS